ncbi:uncharacterized protein LOC142177058 [Nicotiana tabacum]|uniref:Uncharacterized protein LOC142177058 n=1 Tax=Nicotiana tabacum TaxID=4097 RepID=A0AC58TWN5_TOBAC
MDKLESRTEVCIFIGYPKGTKGGLFYCPKEQKELNNGVTKDSSLERIPESSIDNHCIIVVGEMSICSRLHESNCLTSHYPKVVRPALQEEINDIPAPQGVEDNIEALVPENNVVIQQQNQPLPVVTSLSGRIIRKHLRFMLLGESYDRIPEEPNTEPINYDEALQDIDADKWVDAMKSEMESMYSNQVWDLVEPPTGVKPIGCRWIYKKKRGVDGKV